MTAESSLEKARAAAREWFDENVSITDCPGDFAIYVVELLAAYADSAVALEREQCAQIARACGLSPTTRSMDGMTMGLFIETTIRARGERKAGENG